MLVNKMTILSCILGLFISVHSWAEQYDVVIKNGLVIDGEREVGKKLTVAVTDGKIVYVGPRVDLQAGRIINAQGLVISPGFIDVHNHADTALSSGSSLENEGYIRQGVTTVVTGPDGNLAPNDIRKIQSYIRKNGSSTNVAVYVGQNGVRNEVMGMAPVLSNPQQLSAMKALVKDGMELGAVGLSTGLMYPPGMYSNTEEIIQLAQVAASFGGSYDSHVRNPVHALIQSYQEAIEIGRQANIPVKLGHVKIVGLKNRDIFPQVQKLVNDARNDGINVVSDQYPYDGAYNLWLWEIVALPEALMPKDKNAVSSDYSQAPSRDWLVALLNDPQKRLAIKQFNETNTEHFSWAKAVGYFSMRVVVSKEQPDLVGKHISEIATQLNKSEFDVIADMITDQNLNVNITLGSVLEENVRHFLRQPWNMISSDGLWSNTINDLVSHPRSTGSFPRILGRYVRSEGLLDLSEAIYKMSAFPADFLGLGKRGYIQEGYIGDIAIFNPLTISDKSDWLHPEYLSVGMRYVLVNGRLVLDDGKMTDTMAGKYVRHKRVTDDN